MTRKLAVGLLLAALGAVLVLAAVAGASGVHLTQLVGWNEPDRLVKVLGIVPGMAVADVGAGSGWIAVKVARRVGAEGKVFATEIDRERLAEIRAAAAREQLDNIAVVAAGERETGLPGACCEVVYLRYVFHHLDAPAALAQSLFASVAPGGRLGIIDFAPRGFFRGHGVHQEDVVREITGAGFRLKSVERRWGQLGYLLVFERPRAG